MAIATTALVLCIIFPVLASLSVIGRFLARTRCKAPYGPDDWVIIPALILSLGNAATVLWDAKVSRLGQHEQTDPDWRTKIGPQDSAFQMTGYISELIVTTAITLARLSIILFYVRIFPSPKFRLWAKVIASINVLFGLVFLFIFMFQCTPINEFWLVAHNQRHHCINPVINDPYAILSVVLDFAVLCMPWPIVWHLQLSLKRKLAVLSIFMLGAVIIAVSIGKAYAFFHVFKNAQATQDFSYVEAPLLFWTVPECCLSVTCACLPTLSPIFRDLSVESILQSFKNLLSCRTYSSRLQRNLNRPHIEIAGYKRHNIIPDSGSAAAARNESTVGFCKTSSSLEGRNEDTCLHPSEQIPRLPANMTDLELGDFGVPTRRGLETRANRL